MQKEIVEPRGTNSNKHRTIIIKTSARRLKTFLRQNLTLHYLTCTALHIVTPNTLLVTGNFNNTWVEKESSASVTIVSTLELTWSSEIKCKTSYALQNFTAKHQNSEQQYRKKMVQFSRFQNFKHSRPEGEIKARCWTKRDSRTKAE
jgi:hypothetical protein